MTARTYAADDVPEINRNLARVRRNCFQKLFGSSTGCWCMGYYPDGTSASCNTARELIGIEKPGVIAIAPSSDKTYCTVCTAWRLNGCTNAACPMPLPTDASGVCSRFDALVFHSTACSCGHPENSASCDRWGCWTFGR